MHSLTKPPATNCKWNSSRLVPFAVSAATAAVERISIGDFGERPTTGLGWHLIEANKIKEGKKAAPIIRRSLPKLRKIGTI